VVSEKRNSLDLLYQSEWSVKLSKVSFGPPSWGLGSRDQCKSDQPCLEALSHERHHQGPSDCGPPGLKESQKALPGQGSADDLTPEGGYFLAPIVRSHIWGGSRRGASVVVYQWGCRTQGVGLVAYLSGHFLADQFTNKLGSIPINPNKSDQRLANTKHEEPKLQVKATKRSSPLMPCSSKSVL
jgi:hypothetical protein